jgi:hypothetical protein
MDVNSQCHNCTHLNRAAVGYACEAFPQGIPSIIVLNQFDHRLPHPDDHGIRYEARDPLYETGFTEKPDATRQPDPYAKPKE